MGISADSQGTPIPCQSSNLPRTIEKVDFYDDSFGFSFTNEDFTEETNELDTNPRARELYFDKIQDDITQPGVYFWRLPAQFTGNQLGSYGGELNFTLRTKPLYVSSEGPLVILKVNSVISNSGSLFKPIQAYSNTLPHGINQGWISLK